MMQIKARDLINKTKDEIWALPEGRFKLIFDDGEMETDNRRTIFSYYYWMPHRKYPEAPILLKHHIGDRDMSPGVHLDLCSATLFDTYFALDEKIDRMELAEMGYDITTDLYNDFTYRLEPWVTTVSILDYIDILDHPPIKEANEKAEPTEKSITATYKTISEHMRDDELKGNNIRLFTRSKIVSGDQVLQSIGPRGHVTDIDSNIFPNPIMVGYTEGFKKLEESMIESRSGTKALMMAKDPLSKTQYFNRRMQLGCSNIQNLHHGDCGSDQYVNFHVRERDLDALNGKWYRDDKSKKLKVIGTASKELIGQTVKLRSSITCHHKDPYGVCSTCMGLISLSVPDGTNIGHVAATELCSQVTQKVLSTKHLDKTSKLVVLEPTETHSKIVRVNPENGDVLFQPKFKLDGVKLTVLNSWADHIGDIQKTDNVLELTPSRISEVPMMLLNIERGNATTEEMIPMRVGGTTLASLSVEMLQYIKNQGFSYDTEGNYIVDLKDWNSNNPVMNFPRKHLSMIEYMRRIASIIESGVVHDDDNRRRVSKKGDVGYKVLANFDSPSAALDYLYTEVSSKCFVNIAHLELIIRSTMIRNSEKSDHRLPHPHHNFECGKYKDNMNLRSLSAQMAFCEHRSTLTNPVTFITRNRPDHPMDALLGANVKQ